MAKYGRILFMAIGFGLLLGVCQLWFGMLALTMVTKRLDQTKAEQAETWETVTDYSSLGLNYGAVDAEVDRGAAHFRRLPMDSPLLRQLLLPSSIF